MPSVGDPCWESWTTPLHAFLAEPRDWKSLKEWARSRKTGPERLRHYIAWLEEAGKAQSFYVDGVLYWRGIGHRRKIGVLCAGAGPTLSDLDEGTIESLFAHRE